MKNILFFAMFLTFTACKTNSKATEKETFRGNVTMEIQEIMTDSISIRALDYGNGDYWYSGSDGKYGRINSATGAINKLQLTSMEEKWNTDL